MIVLQEATDFLSRHEFKFKSFFKIIISVSVLKVFMCWSIKQYLYHCYYGTGGLKHRNRKYADGEIASGKNTTERQDVNISLSNSMSFKILILMTLPQCFSQKMSGLGFHNTTIYFT